MSIKHTPIIVEGKIKAILFEKDGLLYQVDLYEPLESLDEQVAIGIFNSNFVIGG